MAEYPPPTDNFPIFDALAFTAPLNATITQAQADVKYLARTGVAVSVADTTSFTDNITIGSALIDFVSGQGLELSSTSIIATPSQTATGLNGLVCNSAMFGRNDIGANTFSGTLSYTRHPIGWTISVSKAVAIPTSNVTVNIITAGTPTTVFNNLSNGVWKFGVTCNNDAGLGAMTYAVMSYGAITGGTAINGSTSQLYHQTTAGLSNMGLSYPELIVRTTGNGVTGIVINWICTYSVAPTITFNMWAVKIA